MNKLKYPKAFYEYAGIDGKANISLSKKVELLKKWKLAGKPNPKKQNKRHTKSQQVAYRKNLPYKEFLQTDYWKKVRAKVLERDGNKCIICKGTYILQVHHDSYKHHGDEMNHLEDLMTLCKNCHKEHHYAQK